jgi:uridine phosphorylase
MTSQDVHSEIQHHIDMKKGDVAATVLVPERTQRWKCLLSLLDEATKVAEKRNMSHLHR